MGYVDLNYKPKPSDLICEFRVKPYRTSISNAAENLAAESSIGTWTDVTTEKRYVKKLAAKVFSIKKNRGYGIVKIAYPLELFEPHNIPNVMSSIAGNIFGMKVISKLKLEDINIPTKLMKSFKGPRFGINGVRRVLKIKERPLLGTIIKPKLGLKTNDHAKVAYEAWLGGCDIVKDDENLANQKFNPFEDRVIKTLEARDMAESETGEKKAYMPNVTAETDEMIKRAEFVKQHGGRYVMIDIITSGWSALQTLRDSDLGLILHAHRAGHAAFTRGDHGISMLVIAKIARLIGVDQIHIGTVVGKMEGGYEEVHEIEENIEKKLIKEHNHVLSEKWYNIKPVFAVCSGGLHPGHVPKLIKMLGKDIIIQMGGGIHGHPCGTQIGATAARYAIEASLKGIPLKTYAKHHPELSAALKKWA